MKNYFNVAIILCVSLFSYGISAEELSSEIGETENGIALTNQEELSILNVSTSYYVFEDYFIMLVDINFGEGNNSEIPYLNVNYGNNGQTEFQMTKQGENSASYSGKIPLSELNNGENLIKVSYAGYSIIEEHVMI